MYRDSLRSSWPGDIPPARRPRTKKKKVIPRRESLCPNCPRWSRCVELCEAANRYVDQDYVSQRDQCYSTLPNFDKEGKATLNSDFEKIVNSESLFELSELVAYFTAEKLEFECLNQLQNKILHLFHFEGLTYREIAISLSGGKKKRSISESSVKQRLKRIKEKLRHYYSKSREDEQVFY